MARRMAEAWRWGVLLALPLAGEAMAQIPPLPTELVAPAPVAPDGAASAPAASEGSSAGVAAPTGALLGPAGTLGGSAFQPGSLGFPYNTVAEQADGTTRAFRITPSIAGQILGTDNPQQTARRTRGDFITSITPGLLVTADTARLQGTLNYTPTLQIYAVDTAQTRFLQRFNGQLLTTILPGSLFLDMRGSAAQQAVGGGFAPQANPVIDRRNQVQTTAFQISPYYAHRFGDTATVQAGYAFQSVTQDVGGNATGALGPDGQRFFSNQSFIAHEVYGVARSGPEFGRLALESRVTSTDYDGTGVLRNAYRRLATVEARYAVTRQFSALAELGYGTQHYAGRPGFSLAEPVWAVGGRLTLSEESWVTLKYQRRDGFNSPAADAVIALGGRTRLFANYGERLTTGAQRAADLLTSTTLDALGNPVDQLTGAPVVQPFSDSFLGAQSSLQRIRRAAVSVSQSWPRDVIALTYSYEQRRPISIEQGSSSFAQRGSSIGLSWSHALTPSTSVIGQLQYGQLTRQGFGTSDVYTASASVVTQLAPRLSAYAQYALTNRSDEFGTGFLASNTAPGRAVQNVVIVGLRQSF